ncbi:hypothetical protein K2173_002508 [Erythroxylum novogranatense]|uniref:protein-serine/threonine phosphatase n=1 Tax=Erythroxylum novogranatense TaxID=1862640 RepID=A0AAV8TTS6_9ROSI|nr:hypothetical protein K2173_002508 [Erythroxylum novogranatense]
MLLDMCFRPLGRCFGGGEERDALLWDIDLKPHASGVYSVAVVQANSLLEDQGQVLTSPSATYVGIYDGHGGPEASKFITDNLFPFLQIGCSFVLKFKGSSCLILAKIIRMKFATEHGGLSADVIRKAFEATEKEFSHLVNRSWMTQPQMVSVGSCCLVGAISKGVLYVANLGDSRAVLGRRVHKNTSTMVVAERLSTDHNVSVEEVRKEVVALHPDDSHIVMYCNGVWRIKGIIQVSRSIGDMYLKKPEFSQQFGSPISLKAPVMTAEPSILIRKLRPDDLFLIFASDGLWEQLSDEAAVNIVLKNPRVGIAKRLVRAALQEVARKREMIYEDIKKIEKGARRFYHDDMTVVVMYIDQPRGTSNRRFDDDDHVDCTNVPVDIFSLNKGETQN